MDNFVSCFFIKPVTEESFEQMLLKRLLYDGVLLYDAVMSKINNNDQFSCLIYQKKIEYLGRRLNIMHTGNGTP